MAGIAPLSYIQDAAIYLAGLLTTTGDLLYRGAGGLTRRGIGATGQVLTVVAGLPAWAASATSTLTTTGDILGASAPNVLTRIAGGATGTFLGGNGAGVLPTYQTLPAELDTWTTRQGLQVNRTSPASANIVLGAGLVAAASGGAYAKGTDCAFGSMRRATVTADSYVCGFSADVMDLEMVQHRFTGTFAFSGVLGAARRFFAGVAKNAQSFAAEVVTSDAPTAPTIGFFVRGLTDTTFQIVCANDSGTQIVNTGITATEGAAYRGVYAINKATLLVTWSLWSALPDVVPVLLGSGSFTATSSPFASSAADLGILVMAKPNAVTTYWVQIGDVWVNQGVTA